MSVICSLCSQVISHFRLFTLLLKFLLIKCPTSVFLLLLLYHSVCVILIVALHGFSGYWNELHKSETEWLTQKVSVWIHILKILLVFCFFFRVKITKIYQYISQEMIACGKSGVRHKGRHQVVMWWKMLHAADTSQVDHLYYIATHAHITLIM